MSFFIYDLIFLVLFLVFFSVFLYTRKHNLKKEGLLYLYRTKWGMRMIDQTGHKYKKTLGVLGYASFISGYILMISALYFIYLVVKIYFFSPDVVRAIKVPPVIPLVPYLPQVFSLDFLPPFYFTYWIVIIAIIAITHEMAHGIFMRKYNVKIKSTGFAFFPWFFPIFPAAFVEQDEQSMNKAGKFEQMVILAAGTFANVLTAVFFFIILFWFFSAAFAPAGVIFDTYATTTISIAGISSINGVPVTGNFYENVLGLTDESGLNEISSGDEIYLATKSMLESQEGNENIYAYYSAPAIKANLSRIITEVNGKGITNTDVLFEEISDKSPGDEITITTLTSNGEKETTIFLEEHPEAPGSAWLGIGFISQNNGRIIGSIIEKVSFKEPNLYYESKLGEFNIFIYNLLWWVVLISISVALVNMLPVGIFDGGRFFYLTILGLTKNEKFAKKAFAFSTWFFLFLLLLIMIFWAISWV